ncbi:hypothetical protein PCL_01060 [Purpureocillium lilacinum]|uniref:CFEM domain-containing protein n=1 Tax=Purpureocillium lilacinum TaxID=33203 RepID=A0A2U3E4H1_PURLI|nr:hypothetical protein PCL_01060 [Purpureocillium lilacinum]
MRISAFSVAAAFLSAAIAQGTSPASLLSQLPSCALECFASALPSSSCSPTDQKCLCASEQFSNNVTVCVTKSCTIKESLSSRPYPNPNHYSLTPAPGTLNITKTNCGAPIRDKSQVYSDTAAAFSVLAGVFIIQRFAYKIYTKLDICLDDWFALLTMIIAVPGAIINAHYVPVNGLGRDIWTLTPQQITNFLRFFYFQEIIYVIEVSVLKLSFLFFYRRIFPGTTIRWLLWGTIAFNTLVGAVFTLVCIFQCRPIKYFWEQWDQEHRGKCLNINAIGWSSAAISIALDVWMLALPLWQIRTLRLDWKKKIGVGLMFGTGAFITIVSILRLRSLLAFRSDSMNPTWEFFEVGLWSAVEICIGIVCACLPSLRLLLVHVFPKQFGTSAKRDTGRYIHMYDAGSRMGSRPRHVTDIDDGDDTDAFHTQPVKGGSGGDAFKLVVTRHLGGLDPGAKK